jgi:hypothetical protein
MRDGMRRVAKEGKDRGSNKRVRERGRARDDERR